MVDHHEPHIGGGAPAQAGGRVCHAGARQVVRQVVAGPTGVLVQQANDPAIHSIHGSPAGVGDVGLAAPLDHWTSPCTRVELGLAESAGAVAVPGSGMEELVAKVGASSEAADLCVLGRTEASPPCI